MARPTKTYTPSAEVRWSGDVGADFRKKAEVAIAAALSDEAWGALWNVVFSYAGLLAHDAQGAPLRDQLDLIDEAARLSSELHILLERLETPAMGRALSNVITDAWEAVRGTEAEFERDLETAKRELGSLVSQEMSDELLAAWQGRGFIEHPSPGLDFKVDLHVFSEAAKRAASDIRDGSAPTTRDPFEDLVAMICVWADEQSIKLGATKLDAYDNFGTFPALVKAILWEVPEFRDENGDLEPIQIRRYTDITDGTLASYVIRTRQRHYARMKALGKERAAAAAN